MIVKVRVFDSVDSTKIEIPNEMIVKKEDLTMPLNLNKPAEKVGVYIHIDLNSIKDNDKFLLSAGVENPATGYLLGSTIKDYFDKTGEDMLIIDLFDPRFVKKGTLV